MLYFTLLFLSNNIWMPIFCTTLVQLCCFIMSKLSELKFLYFVIFVCYNVSFVFNIETPFSLMVYILPVELKCWSICWSKQHNMQWHQYQKWNPTNFGYMGLSNWHIIYHLCKRPRKRYLNYHFFGYIWDRTSTPT